jgi:hypothetical protein
MVVAKRRSRLGTRLSQDDPKYGWHSPVGGISHGLRWFPEAE